MEWLAQHLLGDDKDKGMLWDRLTYVLACRHCGSSCFQSPGILATLFLFMVWQIRRWWQLERRRQFQCWYSGDMMQGKDQPILHCLTFLDCLWKHKSEEEKEEEEEEEEKEEEEEEEEEEEKEEEEACLNLLELYSLPKKAPVGEQATSGSSQSTRGADVFYKATGTSEQVLMQTPNPSRFFPTFQILTNLPVRHKRLSGNCLQQSQLFWGLPSLHSESLEAIFLSSRGPPPLKLSVGPSVFFNKFASLSRTKLLLFPQYCFPTQLPTHEVHSPEDLEGMAADPQQLSRPSLPSQPSLPLHLKSFPKDHKRVLSGPEAHPQWLTQQREMEVPWASAEQVLYPQPKLQRNRESKLFRSLEIQEGVPWDPTVQQHILESLSASLLYSSSLLVLTGYEDPQNKDPKISKLPVPAPSSTSLPELQGVSPIGLSGSQDLWDTTRQTKKLPTSESSILAICQSNPSMAGPEEINPLGIPPGFETQWRSIRHKENLQVSEAPVPALCQVPSKSPGDKCSVPKDFWGTMGHEDNCQISGSPVPVPCPPPESLAKLQEGRPLGDPFAYKLQWECREKSGKPWVFEPPALNLKPVFHETRPAYTPSGFENSWEGMQDRVIPWVSIDPVSSPNLPSVSLLESLTVGPQGVLSESTALWETTGQKENGWNSESPAPALSPPLDLLLESHSINPVGGFTQSDAERGDSEHSSNSEPPSLTLSSPSALILEPFRVNSMRALFDSEDRCRDIQRRNSWVSEPTDYSLLQNPHDTRLLGVQSDPEPIWRDKEYKEINCVPVSPAWGPRPPPNSTSKSHVSEPSRGQCNRKLEGEAMEEIENPCAIELPAPTPTSPLRNPHLEFVWRNMQPRAIPRGSSPPGADLLSPIPWSPTLAEALKTESSKSGLSKGTPVPGGKAETLPSQGEASPGMSSHSGIQAWHWSRELEITLKKLQLDPASRSPGPSQSGSFPALGSTPGSWGLSSCPPQQTHGPSLCPRSSSYHPIKVQSTPVQFPHCHHPNSSFWSHLGGSGKAKQGSEREENRKAKMVAQVLAQRPCHHMKAGENCPSIGESSNLKVRVSGKRQDKASAKERASPKSPQEIDHREGDARLGSSTVQGKSHPAQAQRLAEVSVNTISQRYHYRDQSSQHAALPQQLNSSAAGAQDQQGTGMGAGDIPIPRHCKHCPWAHMKHLSSKPQAPLTRGLQRVLAKFVATNGVHSPVSRKKANSTGIE